MADISVIVDYSSVKAANREIEKTGSSAQKSAKVFEAAFKSAEIQTKKNLKAVRDQINFSKRMEAQRVKEAKASAQAARNQANEEERLRSKFVAGHSAMNIYSRELDELARARKLDIISAQQQAAAVESLNKDFKAGTGIFANYANGVMKGANRMGVAMQQTGYQVGDFLVQVQSGTNPMVAFGQQATQLVGVLYLLPQATLAAKVGLMGLQVSLGAVVAVVSILIPLATAIGAYFLRAGEDAKEASSGVKTFEDRLKSARDEVISMREALDLLNSGYENQSIKTFADRVDTAQKKLAEARAKIDEAIAPALETAIKQSKAMGSEYTPEVLEEFAEKLKLLAAPELRGAVSEAVRELAEARELLRQEEQRRRDSSVKNQLSESRAIIQEQEAAAEEDYQKRLSRTRVIMGQMVAERRAAAKKEAEEDRLENIKTLARAELELFKANAAYEKKQEELDASGDKVILENQARAELELFKANAAYEKKQKELDAAGDIAILENQARAELELNKANDAYEKMSDSERQKRLDELNDKVEEMAERLSIPFAAALGLIRQAKEEATVGLDAFGGPGSFKYGGSQTFTPDKTKKVKKSDIELLRERLALEEALVGKTETQKVLLQELGVNYEKIYGKDSIIKLETRVEKLRQITEEEAKVKDLANTIGSAMENSLMSMVDGTKSVKDAFRDMALDIVKHLYKVLVVQQMINAIGGMMSGSSNASIAKIGGALESYDNGGYTGNGPRSGGLDGKGGFMAMMHPRETVVDHTKPNSGGTGQNVVINQSFNFQANGDDSVKKIIAQAAPQIAQMTKKSMLDDRRRGGQMKATFG